MLEPTKYEKALDRIERLESLVGFFVGRMQDAWDIEHINRYVEHACGRDFSWSEARNRFCKRLEAELDEED